MTRGGSPCNPDSKMHSRQTGVDTLPHGSGGGHSLLHPFYLPCLAPPPKQRTNPQVCSGTWMLWDLDWCCIKLKVRISQPHQPTPHPMSHCTA